MEKVRKPCGNLSNVAVVRSEGSDERNSDDQSPRTALADEANSGGQNDRTSPYPALIETHSGLTSFEHIHMYSFDHALLCLG